MVVNEANLAQIEFMKSFGQELTETPAGLGHSGDKGAQPRENPDPSTWRFDASGHLLSAGKEFYAKYDDRGGAVTAMMKGEIWKQTPEGVRHGFVDTDGQWQNVFTPCASLCIRTYSGTHHGAFFGAEVIVQDIDGNFSSHSHELFRDAERARYLAQYWDTYQ